MPMCRCLIGRRVIRRSPISEKLGRAAASNCSYLSSEGVCSNKAIISCASPNVVNIPIASYTSRRKGNSSFSSISGRSLPSQLPPFISPSYTLRWMPCSASGASASSKGTPFSPMLTLFASPMKRYAPIFLEVRYERFWFVRLNKALIAALKPAKFLGQHARTFGNYEQRGS